MKASHLAGVAGLLFAAAAHAQHAPEPPKPVLAPEASAGKEAFERSHAPYPRVYGDNTTANPNDTIIKGYRTDPKLVAGVEVAPNLALEAGHAPLLDRGFRKIDEGRPEDVSGALGATGSSNYVAGKVSIPLTEQLSVHGKMGVAYSERKTPSIKEADTGLYTGVGARYRLNDNASVDADYSRHGHAAKKWGGATNADGVKARLKIGF